MTSFLRLIFMAASNKVSVYTITSIFMKEMRKQCGNFSFSLFCGVTVHAITGAS